jgi:hypothetical protein
MSLPGDRLDYSADWLARLDAGARGASLKAALPGTCILNEHKTHGKACGQPAAGLLVSICQHEHLGMDPMCDPCAAWVLSSSRILQCMICAEAQPAPWLGKWRCLPHQGCRLHSRLMPLGWQPSGPAPRPAVIDESLVWRAA